MVKKMIEAQEKQMAGKETNIKRKTKKVRLPQITAAGALFTYHDQTIS